MNLQPPSRHHYRRGTGSSTESQTQTQVRTAQVQTQTTLDVEQQGTVHESIYNSREVQEEAYLDGEDPENGDVSPTPSHYETESDEPGCQYLLASDVRRQVRQAPRSRGLMPARGGYPHKYNNREGLAMRSEPPYSEYPILPSPGRGQSGGNWRRGIPVGPVRAFYNEADREVFDVGYHENRPTENRPTDSELRKPMNRESTPFRLATYRPASYSREKGEKPKF